MAPSRLGSLWAFPAPGRGSGVVGIPLRARPLGIAWGENWAQRPLAPDLEANAVVQSSAASSTEIVDFCKRAHLYRTDRHRAKV